MFSYQKVIQDIADNSIFSRGLKIYLEGGVIKYKKLILDGWRQYLVHDTSKKITYEVKAPVLHKTIRIENIESEKLSVAVNDFVTCNCDYFIQEQRVCRHIVATFASLENEFMPKKKFVSNNLDGVFQQIQETEKNKKYQEYLIEFQNLLDYPRSQNKYKFLAKLNQSLITNEFSENEIEELKGQYLKDLKKHLGDWESEKKYYANVLLLLSQNQRFWVELLIPTFDYLERENIVRIIAEMFKNKIGLEYYSFFIKQINLKLKDYGLDKCFEEVKEILGLDFKDSLNLAFDLEYHKFIEENSSKIDPLGLLKFLETRPDLIESYELIIIQQLKEWLYFITNEDYDKIEDVLTAWIKLNNGISYNLREFFDYLKTDYKKRRKLMGIIDRLS